MAATVGDVRRWLEKKKVERNDHFDGVRAAFHAEFWDDVPAQHSSVLRYAAYVSSKKAAWVTTAYRYAESPSHLRFCWEVLGLEEVIKLKRMFDQREGCSVQVYEPSRAKTLTISGRAFLNVKVSGNKRRAPPDDGARY